MIERLQKKLPYATFFSWTFLASYILASILLSGCASIAGSETETLSISSTPPDAQILIIDEAGRTAYRGRTPEKIAMTKSDGQYFGGKQFTVTVSKRGYVTQRIKVDTRPNSLYLAGNLVFGGAIGWLISDPTSGKMYSLTQEGIEVTLQALPVTPSPPENKAPPPEVVTPPLVSAPAPPPPGLMDRIRTWLNRHEPSEPNSPSAKDSALTTPNTSGTTPAPSSSRAPSSVLPKTEAVERELDSGSDRTSTHLANMTRGQRAELLKKMIDENADPNAIASLRSKIEEIDGKGSADAVTPRSAPMPASPSSETGTSPPASSEPKPAPPYWPTPPMLPISPSSGFSSDFRFA